MLYPENVQSMHVELTNKCNAKCPLCIRQLHNIKEYTEMSIKNFKIFFPSSFIKKISRINFCGNYGDPSLCKDIFEIHNYVLECNPNIILNMSTNGGANNENFWYKLGFLYKNNKESFVKFCIDGLESTNHIYRKGVVWNQLIKNIKSFISTEAKAEWSFIPFEHNQHQLEDVRLLSKELGFNYFHIRYSRRFENDEFDVHLPTDSIIKSLQKTKTNESMYKRCVAYNKKEIYVDSWGNVFPCCWYGSITNDLVDAKYSLKYRTLDEIIKEPLFQHDIEYSWNFYNSKCQKSCWALYKKYL